MGVFCGRRALLACLDEAQASSQDGQGSLPPSLPGTACAGRERTAGVPACAENHAVQRQPAAAPSRENSVNAAYDSKAQQLPCDKAPAVSHPECASEARAMRADQRQEQCSGAPAPSQSQAASEALAAPAAQGQPQCGHAPGPSQPESNSPAASALADLHLDSAPRKRLPTSRSLCYSEGSAILDERCMAGDACRAAADERSNGSSVGPAVPDERGNGENPSPADEDPGCSCSGDSPAGAGAHSGARGAGPHAALETGCCSGSGPNLVAWRLEEAEALVVYGLGSLEGGPVPRHQLALALLLAARMPALRQPIEVGLSASVPLCSARASWQTGVCSPRGGHWELWCGVRSVKRSINRIVCFMSRVCYAHVFLGILLQCEQALPSRVFSVCGLRVGFNRMAAKPCQQA